MVEIISHLDDLVVIDLIDVAAQKAVPLIHDDAEARLRFYQKSLERMLTLWQEQYAEEHIDSVRDDSPEDLDKKINARRAWIANILDQSISSHIARYRAYPEKYCDPLYRNY